MNSRRKLLKGIAWSTPVVQTIILPAHAQTSATTSDPNSVCQSALTIPGQVVTLCVTDFNPSTDQFEYKLVKNSSNCIDLETNITSGGAISPSVDITVGLSNDPDGAAAIVVYLKGVLIGSTKLSDGTPSPNRFCQTLPNDPDENNIVISPGEFNETISITDPNGDQWQGQAQTTISGLDITLSDIVLTRA